VCAALGGVEERSRTPGRDVGNGATGIAGLVSTAIAWWGSTAGDQICGAGITPLANGNYVVTSMYWSRRKHPRGWAVTWGDGTTGLTGAVSAANSLVGSTEWAGRRRRRWWRR